MTGTVTDIKRFAVHDGDGIRTTLFLKGCPLRCIWCHNPEGLSSRPELALYAHKCTGCQRCAAVCPAGAHRFENGVHTVDESLCAACGKCADECLYGALRLYGREMTAAEVLPQLLEDRDFYAFGGGGVTLSGGECLLQADFCAEVLRALKAEGINTAVDTCGAVPRTAFEKVLPYTDTFLYDLKAVSAEVHRRCTCRSNELILDNLRFLSGAGARTEIRVPLVAGFNDGEIPAMAALLAPLRGIRRVRLLRYHDLARSKYAALGREDTMPRTVTENTHVEAAARVLREAGLNVVTDLDDGSPART